MRLQSSDHPGTQTMVDTPPTPPLSTKVREMFLRTALIVVVIGLLSGNVASAGPDDLSIAEPEKVSLLKQVLRNIVVHAALQEAALGGEKCIAKMVSATKPQNAKNEAPIDFDAGINCYLRREKLFVRLIRITGHLSDKEFQNVTIVMQHHDTRCCGGKSSPASAADAIQNRRE
jgi:hypothetical protein